MTRFLDKALAIPRFGKRAIALAVDLVLCLGTVAIAYALRLDHFFWPVGRQWMSYAFAPLFAIPLFISFGLYRAIFRYAGWGAVRAILQACVIYGLFYFTLFTAVGIDSIPRTVGAIQPILLFLGVAGSRAITGFLLGGRYKQITRREKRRAIIYGAGSAGRQLAAALKSAKQMDVVAFIDDDPRVHMATIDGEPIYPLSRLESLVERLKVSEILLAIPSASRKRRREIIARLQPLPVTIRILPAVVDLASGKVTVKDLREVDIEDLLGRETVAPNADLLSKSLVGKRVMVTGAGGSIGSELCRQILKAGPAKLLLVDMNEYNLYAIEHELRPLADEAGIELLPLLGSVLDEPRMRGIFASFAPETVFHAAAYKHVPLVQQNQLEGIRNNVLGTYVVARLAGEYGVSECVLVSTDKAVRPTNIMGASKRMAEQVLQALATEGGTTRYSMVRFGNVLGSSGSVVPLFRRQIAQGGPVTVTDERITRYFMTIPEAAQLVLQAGAMATGGEVFVLDMGQPVRIVDLARNMIELSGLTVRDEKSGEGDIAIEVIGMRNGEKLYEELLIGENPMPTGHPRIMKAHDTFMPWPQLQDKLEILQQAGQRNDVTVAREILFECVPEYNPTYETADAAE